SPCGRRSPTSGPDQLGKVVTAHTMRKQRRAPYVWWARAFEANEYAGLLASGQSPRLPHLDEVPVGIANVRTYFTAVVLGLGEELGALGRPLLIDARDVRHADVEERARLIWVGRSGERDRRLVVR